MTLKEEEAMSTEQNKGKPQRAGYLWLRNNIVGLVALFVALSGTAVAAQMASKAGDGAVSKAPRRRRPSVGRKDRRDRPERTG
jgi:hypothetical protein